MTDDLLSQDSTTVDAAHWSWHELTNDLLLSPTLQTRLDLYFSKLALASSPVLFWNLCVQSEIWISIVICGLAAVVGQASKAPPQGVYN
jgi:hypothetical protein